MYENVLFDVADGVATITLNRPDKLNAYTTEMGDEVYDAFQKVRDDDAVRSVILTGAGRGFCAGVDLEHLKAHQAGANASKGPKLGEEAFLRKLPLELLEFPKPVIAAVNGHAIGVGITMILPCDLRIAAAGVKMGVTFVRLGILPGLGSTHLLPRLVGPAKARELVLTGRKFTAEEAAEIGLVNEVVPAESLLDRAREVAAEFAESRPDVLAAAKRALQFGEDHGMAESMQNEQDAGVALRRNRGAS
ncbi:MAG: enoyl-CoA hydratase/isomerase family protein [Deltaproteobacteria bacterium]|nr:enoyl-CoA hydratase/isomerase family protein [Deltaproteobacteria bacterium]MBW2445588.1 enoyl-CoA hydratase/isomerase family protein [Deltaproteobacteria bacterium]